MAKDMEDAGFWLPSEFLGDDFFVEGNKTTEVEAGVAGASLASGLYSGSDSNPSSSVESLNGAESEEEDYMDGLTQKMAHFFLQDDDEDSPVLPAVNVKTREIMAGSPESTLNPWAASVKGSPDAPSLVSSPPSTPLEQHNDAWDLLYEAAGQVMRMRLNDDSNRSNFQGLGLLRKPPVISASSNNHSAGYYHTPLNQQQLQAAQFYHLKQQQLMKGKQSRARGGGGGSSGYGGEGRYGRPLGSPSSAWPPLQNPQQQPQPGSGMRAVFLTDAGARKESTGTGVFLPRRVGTPTESRKKPACWTVLLPARVVQALNLNLEEMEAQQRYPGGFVLDHDFLIGRAANTAFSPQKRNHFHPQPPAVGSHDARLPPEWTY